MSNPKVVSAEEAIGTIKSGSTVFVGESCGEPQTLVEALVEDRERLKGTRIVESRRMAGSKYARFSDCFHIVTFHVTSDNREAIRSGKADFLPIKLSELHALFRVDGHLPIDIALVQVSPADNQGYCNLGMTVGHTLDAALSAKKVMAEVNERMPRTFGETRLHMDRFDYIVETSRALVEYPSPETGEVDMAVARNVSQLISDGSVLSLGIGTIPEAVVMSLDGKKDLGVHSGMITDGIIAPIKRKIINNQQKSIDKGKTVTGVALGTDKLFQFINENPEIEMRPFSYTHALNIIAQLDNFVCVNSAVEVDLTGQVNAESIGSVQISTIGGQADFVRGAALSKGGKNIIALPATTKSGKNSRIVSRFNEGTIVSTPRYDVQYVVTEYGIADLWGKTLSQRTEALISIAHPDFRDDLYQASKS